MNERQKPWLRFWLSGAASLACYAPLFAYLNDRDVMAVFMRPDRWYLPVIVAFVISLAHGAFTGYFWEVLGIRGHGPAKME